MYSIEAAVHSPNLKNSIEAWSNALLPGGIIVIIDDFLSVGIARDDPDVDLFARSWIANSVHTTTEIAMWGDKLGVSRLFAVVYLALSRLCLHQLIIYTSHRLL